MRRKVNVELLRARLHDIQENVEKIKVYAALPDETFFADERNLHTVSHLLLVCIEAVAIVCNHLLARLAQKAPASYGECFEGLKSLGILDDALTNSLIGMARFRNILVHRYWDVDSQRVLQYARENLGDFEAYNEQIIRFIARQTGDT
jgi:uncharacterized protein YutE (UPF0331/DUF86 family)